MSRLSARFVGRRVWLAAGTAAVLVASGVTAVQAQAAATACRTTYTVNNQWSGGFSASVSVDNLGDALHGWPLSWSFAPGQTVTQAWNTVVTQAGSTVTAVNPSYAPDLGAGARVSFGFNGAFTAENPVPSLFALNVVNCTGGVLPQPSTGVPSSPAGPSPPASSTPPGPVATPTVAPGAYPNPGVVTGATGTHDPTIVKTPGDIYLRVQTGNNIPLTTSANRTAWSNAGVAFPNGAPWTRAYTGGGSNLWAPDVSYHNGQYYLYYSASTFGSNRSAIFLATSLTGAAGSWTNRGLVIESRSSNNYNAIDPNLIVDDAGRWWLNFGSFWSGMQQIAINPSTGLRADSAIRLIAGRNGGAIEAPYMVKHGSYYYLWVSFDMCCRGASSTYRIMVGRSSSVNGPFLDRNGRAMASGGGTQVLAGHGNIHGPGHQAVFTDDDGDVLVYHYYANNGAALLGINRLGYDSAGWPFAY